MSDLFVRHLWPLALMKSACQFPIKLPDYFCPGNTTGCSLCGLPRKIVIDKSGANTAGIKAINKMLKSFGCPIPIDMVRRKYLNNIIDQDHRFIKRRIRPMLGFKSFASAAFVLAGIEMVNMIRKVQFTPGLRPFQQCAQLAG